MSLAISLGRSAAAKPTSSKAWSRSPGSVSGSLADQAVLWHGYFRLASWLQKNAPGTWRDDLKALGETVTYQRGDGKMYTGDLFSRDNPVWMDTAVMAPGKRGPRVVNNRQAREAAFDILKAAVSGEGLSSIATTQLPLDAVAA